MSEVDISQEALLLSLIDIPMFSNLTRNDLIDVVAMCKLCSYEKGEDIILEGGQSSALYTLVSGSVDIIKKGTTAGSSIKLNTLKCGAVFGETSLFLQEPATATVRACEDTIVMAFMRETFSAYINSHPKGGLVFMTYIILDLIRKLRYCNETIVYEKECSVSSKDLDSLHSLLPFTMSDIISK